jgi:hypothetical protein
VPPAPLPQAAPPPAAAELPTCDPPTPDYPTNELYLANKAHYNSQDYYGWNAAGPVPAPAKGQPPPPTGQPQWGGQ